jgi:hypothetical protein
VIGGRLGRTHCLTEQLVCIGQPPAGKARIGMGEQRRRLDRRVRAARCQRGGSGPPFRSCLKANASCGSRATWMQSRTARVVWADDRGAASTAWWAPLHDVVGVAAADGTQCGDMKLLTLGRQQRGCICCAQQLV